MKTIFKNLPQHIEAEIKEFYQHLETTYPHKSQQVSINFCMKKAEAGCDGSCTSILGGKIAKISVGYGRDSELYELQKVKWILAHEYKHVLQFVQGSAIIGDKNKEKDADAFADQVAGPKPKLKLNYKRPAWLQAKKDSERKEYETARSL